jgi:membrane fusion protein (multidrug efflux system)
MLDGRRRDGASISWHAVASAAAVALFVVAFTVPAIPLALAASPPPPAVTVATVQVQNVAPVNAYIGRVIAIESVQIVPRVTAFIEDVPVQQGSDVKSGQTIYELQKTQYQAAAQAAQASLDSAQVAVHNDQITYDRVARLNKQGFEAQADLDTATVTLQQAQASVLTALANLAQAALNETICRSMYVS